MVQRGNVWALMDSCHPFGVLDRIYAVHTRVNTRACIMITPSGFPCAATGVRIPHNAHALSPKGATTSQAGVSTPVRQTVYVMGTPKGWKQYGRYRGIRIHECSHTNRKYPKRATPSGFWTVSALCTHGFTPVPVL